METTIRKILLSSWVVKRKIAYGNDPAFQVQIEDLGLKWGILGEDSKNKSSGSTMFSPGEIRPALEFNAPPSQQQKTWQGLMITA